VTSDAGGPGAAAPSGGDAPIVARLALRRLDVDAFEGRHPLDRSPVARPVPGRPDDVHVFGGLVLGQALRAAHLTVGGDPHGEGSDHQGSVRRPASAQAAFLRAGLATEPFRYAVERTRDGRAFSARRVVATQDGAPVLTLQATFQVAEDGEEYQAPAVLADLPRPEELPPGRYDGAAFDCRDLPPGTAGPGRAPHARLMWFRARGELPNDPDLHLHALACATDHGPTRAVREPHAGHPGVEGRHSVSLDHAVWFHRPARVDRWLLSELWPISTGAARGLCAGTVRTPDGTLVASVTQQALLRLPS
jgi:acyl-CoA thioesterase II